MTLLEALEAGGPIKRPEMKEYCYQEHLRTPDGFFYFLTKKGAIPEVVKLSIGDIKANDWYEKPADKKIDPSMIDELAKKVGDMVTEKIKKEMRESGGGRK